MRWGEYEQSVIHVRTSHVPRFEIELPSEKAELKESLFKQMGIRYDDFRKLDMQDKMKYIRSLRTEDSSRWTFVVGRR